MEAAKAAGEVQELVVAATEVGELMVMGGYNDSVGGLKVAAVAVTWVDMWMLVFCQRCSKIGELCLE